LKHSKLKQTKSKKITFSTKRVSKPSVEPTVKISFENQMLDKINSDEESTLDEDTKQKLGSIGVITIDDLKKDMAKKKHKKKETIVKLK